MNTPTIVPTKTPMHPLMVIVSICIILVCGLSAAALLGWLPNSTGRNAEAVPDSATPPVVADATQTKAATSKAAPARIDPPVATARKSPPVQRVAIAEQAICRDCGVIDAITPIDRRGEGTAVGTAGGAIVGGLLGNQVGSGNGRKLATVAGAIGGAMAGNQIEGNMKSTRSYDILVRFNDGTSRTFHQSEQPAWRAGDRVRVVNGVVRSEG
jgi:outer membrane lipoprotein SlyB